MQGHTPGELNELGEKQVDALGKRMQDEVFDYIFCSDLNRCVQTLNGVIKNSTNQD